MRQRRDREGKRGRGREGKGGNVRGERKKQRYLERQTETETETKRDGQRVWKKEDREKKSCSKAFAKSNPHLKFLSFYKVQKNSIQNYKYVWLSSRYVLVFNFRVFALFPFCVFFCLIFLSVFLKCLSHFFTPTSQPTNKLQKSPFTTIAKELTPTSNSSTECVTDLD